MSAISWKSFDANKQNPEIEKAIREESAKILATNGIDTNDKDAIKQFAAKQISDYESGNNPELNKTHMVDVFKPHEFDSDCTNDESLAVLRTWLSKKQFNWKEGSKTVQAALTDFPSGGPKRIARGRASVILDGLVEIEGKNVAVEVEVSTNLDNGYWTLRQAVRLKMAHYGVMIVPWTPEGPGRADERIALSRLDDEFEESNQLKDGPIYRIALVRLLDLYRLMLRD